MIYPKAIYNFQVSLTLDVDGNNVLNFAYDIKDNYDSDTGAFDSHNLYSYYIPVSAITLKVVLNQDASTTDYFEINWGKNQLAFAVGEYFSIDANATLEVANVYALIISIILA